ncbi:cytochrome c biogenesis protein CcsA [Methylophaga thalassica]
MERALFQLLTSGFILLTLGLITGLMFVDDLFAQHLVHKTVLSIIAWCVFASLLWGRLRYGWRGQTAVKWTLAGSVFLLLAYMGSKFVLEYLMS